MRSEILNFSRLLTFNINFSQLKNFFFLINQRKIEWKSFTFPGVKFQWNQNFVDDIIIKASSSLVRGKWIVWIFHFYELQKNFHFLQSFTRSSNSTFLTDCRAGECAGFVLNSALAYVQFKLRFSMTNLKFSVSLSPHLFNCGSINLDIFKHDSTHPRLVFLICARNSGQSCFSCPMWINISRNVAIWVLISINICRCCMKWNEKKGGKIYANFKFFHFALNWSENSFQLQRTRATGIFVVDAIGKWKVD